MSPWPQRKAIRPDARADRRHTCAMANPPLSPAQFLSALLAAVHELTGRRPPPTWTHVDKVQRKLGTDNSDAVEAAIRVAVGRGWPRSDGHPASSVTLTSAGGKLLEPGAPWGGEGGKR